MVDNKKNWIDKLKARWGITSTFQVILILIVFSCTGFSVLYVEEIIVEALNIPKELSWWMRAIVFVFLTLPLYNLLLLLWGFVFGQFRFFLNFEKKFFGRIFKIFKR